MKAYDALKYSPGKNISQFKSACTIHCSQNKGEQQRDRCMIVSGDRPNTTRTFSFSGGLLSWWQGNPRSKSMQGRLPSYYKYSPENAEFCSTDFATP